MPMSRETWDLGHPYDKSGSDAVVEHPYKDVTVPWVKPDSILYRDKVIVVLYTVRRGPHGTTYVPGKAYWCWCSVEGREQQAGLFSISGAEDKSPQTWGGLREVTPSQVVAVEWHGDIHTEVWYQGDCYDVDGAPTFRQHGEVPHYDMHIRRNADYSQIPVGLRPKPPEPDPDDHVWGEADGKSFH